MSALALLGAILHPRAPSAKERGSGAAARASVVAGRGGLRDDAVRLLFDARAQGSGLQSLRSLFAHDKPVIAKQFSNASWRHSSALLVEHVQGGNELRIRRDRHLAFPVVLQEVYTSGTGGNADDQRPFARTVERCGRCRCGSMWDHLARIATPRGCCRSGMRDVGSP